MTEPLFEPVEAQFAADFAQYLYLNPFEEQASIAARRQLVGMDLGIAEEEDRRPPVPDAQRSGIDPLVRRIEALLGRLKKRIQAGASPQGYEEQRRVEALITGAVSFRAFEGRRPIREAGDGTGKVPSYRAFLESFREFTSLGCHLSEFFHKPAHAFAVYFQLFRSFDLIYELLRGNSRPVRRLRAEIWHSIFPHELQLYGSLLYDRMHDVTTLILGPSGTGKELVATAIGLSRYVAFDAKRERFSEPLAGAFHPVNLSAMPRDLIESEMFGHCAGAFTGAVKDREGWFEKCALGHAVFLDEIGELDESVQVKLLRVLQSREFYRVGESEPRRFAGKIIAATNRDLGHEIAAGRFRQDLFYRLCSDLVRTPSLREQLDDCPDDLPFLVQLIARKCLGERAWPEQVDWLAELTVRWIQSSPELGMTYEWPGNFRELEQCVRNVMVRGQYHPQRIPVSHTSSMIADTSHQNPGARSPLDRFVSRVRAANLTLDELLENYCSLVFARSPHLTEAARRLGKHRTTIQNRIKPDLVEAYADYPLRSDQAE
jgi:DNA-binding NtrC family response regulator